MKQFLSLGDPRNHIRYCQPVPPASLTTSPEKPRRQQQQQQQAQEENDATADKSLRPLSCAPQSVRDRREGGGSGRETEAPFPGSAMNGGAGAGQREDGGGSIDVGGSGGGVKANDSGRSAVEPAASAKPVDGEGARRLATGEVSTPAGEGVRSAAKRKREGGEEEEEEGRAEATSKRKRECGGVDRVAATAAAAAAPSDSIGAAGSDRVEADRDSEKTVPCAVKNVSSPDGDVRENQPRLGVTAAAAAATAATSAAGADAEAAPAVAAPPGGGGSRSSSAAAGSAGATAPPSPSSRDVADNTPIPADDRRGPVVDLANGDTGVREVGAPRHRPGSSALPISLEEAGAGTGRGKGAHERTAGEMAEGPPPGGVKPPAPEDNKQSYRDGRGADRPAPALGGDGRQETRGGGGGGGGSSDGGNDGSSGRRSGQLRIQAAVVPSCGIGGSSSGGFGGAAGEGRTRNRLRSNSSGSNSNSSSSSGSSTGGNGIVSGEGSRGTKRSREEGGWHAAAAAAGAEEKERRTKSPRR